MVILLQAAVIHQSMFKFLHIDDQDMVKSNLAWPKPNGKKTKTVSTFEVNYRMSLVKGSACKYDSVFKFYLINDLQLRQWLHKAWEQFRFEGNLYYV